MVESHDYVGVSEQFEVLLKARTSELRRQQKQAEQDIIGHLKDAIEELAEKKGYSRVCIPESYVEDRECVRADGTVVDIDWELESMITAVHDALGRRVSGMYTSDVGWLNNRR